MAVKVNWIPTVVMLTLLVWWSVLGILFHGRFPDLQDAVRVVTYLLFAGFVLVAAPALARRAVPGDSAMARRMVVLAIYVIAAVPVAFGLYWSSYDALNPVHARADGTLPDTGALIGRSQHDVARILGTEKIVGQAVLSSDSASDLSRPGGALAQRFVVYSLPDLNTIGARSSESASRQAESQQPALWLHDAATPEQWGSDAVVIAYYSAASRVVGVRVDVSARSAGKALSEVTSQTVLSAMGVDPDVTVDYELRIGGVGSFGSDRGQEATGSVAGRGDVTLVVAPGLVAGASPTTTVVQSTSDTQEDAVQPMAEDQLVAPGASSFSDRSFWVLICSKAYSSEEEAVQKARALNAQRGAAEPCFAVERSGHLWGLGDSDFWVVIYDVGYAEQSAARKAISGSPWGFSLSGVTAVYVTKQCGDFTISSIVE